MKRKSIIKGKILAIILAASMIVDVTPAYTLIASAEEIEDTGAEIPEEEVSDETTENEDEGETEETQEEAEGDSEENKETEDETPEEEDSGEANDSDADSEQEDEVETETEETVDESSEESEEEATEEIEEEILEEEILDEELVGATDYWRFRYDSTKRILTGIDYSGENDQYEVHIMCGEGPSRVSSSTIEVADFAFNGLSYITGASLYDSNITVIGRGAFANNINMQSIQLPHNIRKIGGGAFSGTHLVSGNDINAPTSLVEIGEQAFANNTLGKIDLSRTQITTIKASTFNNCPNLWKVVFPYCLTQIDGAAFYNCAKLGSNDYAISIPDGVTGIGSEAFSGCTSLTLTALPSKIMTIGDSAFKGVDFRGRLVFPSGTTTIGASAFEDCGNITAIELDKTNVTKINAKAFSKCKKLKNIVFSDNITEIGEFAFSGCSDIGNAYGNKITLPFKLNKIGASAFSGCSKLQEVYYGPDLKSIDVSSFGGIENAKTMKHHVYKGSSTEALLRSTFGLTDADLEPYYRDAEDCIILYNNTDGSNNSSTNSPYYTYAGGYKLRKIARAGYTFLGWYKDPGFKKKITEIPAKAKGVQNVYAKWKAHKYTVKYVGNGGTGTTKSQSMTYGKTCTLRANKFKRKGYRFLGWTRVKNGDALLGSTVENLTTKDSGKVTLYAKWQIIPYTLTYVNVDGAGSSTNNPATYTVKNTVKLKAPTRPGYTFKGWYKDSKYKKKITKIVKGSTGNKTLYGKFAANKYNIEFNANGGEGTMESMVGTYAPQLHLPDCGFTKVGKTFLGWNTKADGTGIQYGTTTDLAVFATSQTAAKITLYAQWGD